MPVLAEILSSNAGHTRIHGYAAAQALFRIGGKEAFDALDKQLMRLSDYNEEWGSLYLFHWEMPDPSRSRFIEKYLLKPVGRDVELSFEAKPEDDGHAVRFRLTLKNISPAPITVAPPRGDKLYLRSGDGRYVPWTETGDDDGPRTGKLTTLKPQESQTIEAMAAVKRASEFDPYERSAAGSAQAMLTLGLRRYFLDKPGQFQAVFVVEQTPLSAAQKERQTLENWWAGRAVSPAVTVDLGEAALAEEKIARAESVAAGPKTNVSDADRRKLTDAIGRQLEARSGWSPYYRFSDLLRSELKVVVAAPKAEVATVRAYSGLAKQDIDVCVLPVTIENKSPQPIRTSFAHEWLGGEWPPTDIYAAVLRPAAPGRKANVDFKPVFLADDRNELTKPTVIEPGKSASLSPRLDWPGTGSVHGGEIVYPDRPGVYTVMFLLVFQTDGVRQYVVSEPIAFQYQKPDKDVQLKPAEPKESDPAGKTSTAKPADEAPPATGESTTKAGAKTESTPTPARGTAAELNTDQPWSKIVAKALKDFEVERCDAAASLAVGPHHAYRIVLRHAEKEHVGPVGQFVTFPDNRPVVIRYRRVELAAFTDDALTPEESGRIAWQTWDDEQPYFKKAVHLGRGMGLDWYARATLSDQEMLRERLALEGGDDRLALLTDAIFVQDKGSFTHNLCAYLLSRAGDRAIPYVKAAVEKRKDGDKAIYALGYMRTPAATEYLQSLYAAEATRDMAANALLYPPLRSSAKDQYLDMLKHRVRVTEPMRACVQFHWKDALPLISEIYLRPKSLPEFEAAFEAKRELEGRPVSNEFKQARQNFFRSATQEEYDRFRNFLLKSPDTESAVVFAIPVYVAGGKMNDKDRARARQLGRDVLCQLPRKQVEEILARLIRSFEALPSMQPTAKELSEVLAPE